MVAMVGTLVLVVMAVTAPMVMRRLRPVALVVRVAMLVRWASAVLPERAPAVAPVPMGLVPTAAPAARPVTASLPQPSTWPAVPVVRAVPVATPPVRAPEVKVEPVGPVAVATRLRPVAAMPVPMVARAESAVLVVPQSTVWPVMAASAVVPAMAATVALDYSASTRDSVASAATVDPAVRAVPVARHQVVAAMAPVAMAVTPARVASVGRVLPAILLSR
jgi:hypothetical protein